MAADVGLWGARRALRAGALRLQGEGHGHRGAELGRVRLGHLDDVAAVQRQSHIRKRTTERKLADPAPGQTPAIGITPGVS